MMRRLIHRSALAALAVCAALAAAAPARAVLDPREMLADPAQEARARAIGRELRCLVCQNQSIDDSNADLARDLRMIVRERVVAGDSDAAVLQFVVARYGDFVLLRPPLNAATIALWAAPAIVLGFGILGVVVYFRRRRSEAAPAGADAPATATAPLSPEEQARLARLLDGGDRLA